jgi:hypothetical protein
LLAGSESFDFGRLRDIADKCKRIVHYAKLCIMNIMRSAGLCEVIHGAPLVQCTSVDIGSHNQRLAKNARTSSDTSSLG